ncbi:MAG: hypothetical protein EOP82_28640 [Variovorax sp.]|nr:MAG: hypothetical protein EOP82_28640 [Variovorax sp.]
MPKVLDSAKRIALSRALWATAALVFIVVFLYERYAVLRSAEEQVTMLDPALVIVLRTPGGFLDVATLVKTEEFRWRSSLTCMGRDCGPLLGERIGQIRVPVHYTYRIPLAASWTLRLQGDAYVLSLPAPVPLLPPGIDTAKAEVTSESGGLLPPSNAANQANLLKHLGPELAERAQRMEYLRQQMPAAQKTVSEFAEKWMKEQIKGSPKPVRVEFRLAENS